LFYMGNLVDLWSESQASLVGDDAQPTLTLRNTSTGAALSLVQAAKAGNATVGVGLTVTGQSLASGAVFAFTGDALVSLATAIVTTGGVAGTYGLRVVTPKGTFGWVVVYPDAAITAAAAA
jgi:hypothetical protein